MKAPLTGSFNEMVDAFARIVAKNPVLAEKHGWPRNRTDQEDWLDQREAQRMVAHGWFTFVDIEEGAPSSIPKARRPSFGDVAVGGVKLVAEWLGNDKRPVPIELAESRAAVCAVCPKNEPGDWKQYFTKPAAEKIKFLLGVKHDLDLKTSRDKDLSICSACDCVLSLKVFTPFEIILNNTKEDVWNSLDSRCWILKEREASRLVPKT